ncbi:hypothetical protein PInf_009760 [Phytophthora infestans]|nr:hypothetical protein PInf_009760 [Phytophthora infestans]
MKPPRPPPPDRGRDNNAPHNKQVTGAVSATKGKAEAGEAGGEGRQAAKKKEKIEKKSEDQRVGDEEAPAQWSQDSIVPKTQQSQDEDEDMIEHVGEEVQTVNRNPIAHLEPNETEAEDNGGDSTRSQTETRSGSGAEDNRSRHSNITEVNREASEQSNAYPVEREGVQEPQRDEVADSELGAQEGAADTLPILEEVSTVEPEEMFSAMVTIIRANSGEQPREEWVTSIAELYAIFTVQSVSRKTLCRPIRRDTQNCEEMREHCSITCFVSSML